MATGTDLQARLLQQRMGGPLSEADFMPGIDALPEGIMELEFKPVLQKSGELAFSMIAMMDM